MRDPVKFTRFRQPKPCRSCGKLTTNQPSNFEYMCAKCWDAAGYECEHQDGGHEPGSATGCPMCHPENFPNWK